MRQQLSSFALVAGMLALACATATEDGALAGLGEDSGGSGGDLGVAGSIVNGTSGSSTAGSTSPPIAGTTSGGNTSGGNPTSAFGGTGSDGGSAGKASVGGTASGGKGGSGGTASGGKGGTASGGKGGTASGGSASTTCNGVADWTSKTYATGDTVADTCAGVFAGSCTAGQHHKFECNPAAGVPALPWCQSREPGVGNGWEEAWVDKGVCQ